MNYSGFIKLTYNNHPFLYEQKFIYNKFHQNYRYASLSNNKNNNNYLNISTNYNYFHAIIPIIVAHIAIPPLSYLLGREEIPDFLHPILSFIYSDLIPNEFLDYKFVYELSSKKVKHWKDIYISGLFTHIFVHGDFRHMINNLFHAIQFGYATYARTGSFGLYTLFLLGGVFASLPSPLHNKSSETFQMIGKQSADKFKTTYGLPDFISRPVGQLIEKTGSLVQMVIEPSRGVGSSGSICAFIGFEIVSLIKKIYINVKDLFANRNDPNKNLFKTLVSNEVITSVISIYMSSQFLMSEYTLISPLSHIDSTSLKWFEKISVAMKESRIDHAAHVQGTLFGILFGIFVEILFP